MTKSLRILSTMALLASPSLFAAQDSLQEHLRIEQQLQQKYQKRLKEGTGSTHKNQYKYQYQNQYRYNGTKSNRSGIRSSFGQRSGGGGRH